MQIENILDILYGERKTYKGTKIMRDLLESNSAFRETIIEGIKSDSVKMWPEELWTKLDNLNLRDEYEQMSDAFEAGHNLGRCLVYSINVSYSMPVGCFIVGGTVPYLEGTVNSDQGKHTWVEYQNVIYDTTLMVCIKKNYLEKLKYEEVYKSEPNKNPNYSAAKDFATDSFLNSKKSKK